MSQKSSKQSEEGSSEDQESEQSSQQLSQQEEQNEDSSEVEQESKTEEATAGQSGQQPSGEEVDTGEQLSEADAQQTRGSVKDDISIEEQQDQQQDQIDDLAGIQAQDVQISDELEVDIQGDQLPNELLASDVVFDQFQDDQFDIDNIETYQLDQNTNLEGEAKARKELEDMLVRLEQHFQLEQKARQAAEDQLKDLQQQYEGLEAKLSEEAGKREQIMHSTTSEHQKLQRERGALQKIRQEFEGELQQARGEVEKAQAALAGAEDRVRTKEQIERQKLEKDYELRIAMLEQELNQCKEALQRQNMIISTEVARYQQQMNMTQQIVNEAKNEMIARKRDMDTQRNKIDRVIDKLDMQEPIQQIVQQGLLQVQHQAANDTRRKQGQPQNTNMGGPVGVTGFFPQVGTSFSPQQAGFLKQSQAMVSSRSASKQPKGSSLRTKQTTFPPLANKFPPGPQDENKQTGPRGPPFPAQATKQRAPTMPRQPVGNKPGPLKSAYVASEQQRTGPYQHVKSRYQSKAQLYVQNSGDEVKRRKQMIQQATTAPGRHLPVADKTMVTYIQKWM